jgi:alpha-tubulin suppressor-like RCC1 family protein
VNSSSDISITSNIIIKFNLHKQIKEKLEIDLGNKATIKPKKGMNTYFFGDNREGKCGVGNGEVNVKRP